MNQRLTRLVTGVALLTGGHAAHGQITEGFSYSVYNAPGPNRVVVVAVERSRPEYKLKLGWPQKRRNFTPRQTVSQITGLYDSPPEYEVLAAVNASFFGAVPSITGAAGSDGEMLAQPSGGNETFLFGPARLPMIREDISHRNGRLTFADGSYITLHGYNRVRNNGEVIAYTPQWDAGTRTVDAGVEVILTQVSYPMRAHKEVSGVVTAIRTAGDSINNSIPSGGMVISARGTVANTMQNKVQVGHRLRMFFATSDGNCNNADMSVTGVGWLLRNGVANTSNWLQYGFSDERHPRTVLAWNSTHLFMMVCDGRCPGSVGMTFQELADFLTGTLGATDAVNLDGGGSSTMWVKPSVRNVPSDNCGTERAVANAVLLVRQDTSTQFPFVDAFTSSGRLPNWDDKFTYNPVQAFVPVAPAGDGYVIYVQDPSGGVETVHRGDFGDTNYVVEADVYCEYRPAVAADGYKRYCIFARDSGTGGLGLTSSYGPGNCYALTYDSNNGRIRATKYVNSVIADYREANQVYMPSTAWRRFRIECVDSTIRYLVDGETIAEVIDSSHPNGYFGIGYHEFFGNNANIRGTRADNFSAQALVAPGPATDPQPADQATAVPLDVSLTWSAAVEAHSHHVYFGTTSPGEYRGNQVNTSFDPGPLQINRTYFWRVDEVNAYGTTPGQVWSFRTQRYRGDFNDDCDVDQEDFGRFQACFSGIGNPQSDPDCDRAKLDPAGNPNHDVSEADLSLFLNCVSGPDIIPPADCLE